MRLLGMSYSYDNIGKGSWRVIYDFIEFCLEIYSGGRRQVHTEWVVFWIVGACAGTDGYQT